MALTLFNIGRYTIDATHAVVGAYSYGNQQEYSEFYSVNMHRAYLQPSIALTSKFIDIGLSMRMSYVDFGFKNNTSIQYNREDYDLFSIEDHNYYFLEPQIFARVGYKWVKIGLYINEAHNLTKHEIEYKDGDFGLILHLQFKIDDLINGIRKI